jgi:hypothetical protein
MTSSNPHAQFGEVVSALGPGEKTPGWEINPTVSEVGEFR